MWREDALNVKMNMNNGWVQCEFWVENHVKYLSVKDLNWLAIIRNDYDLRHEIICT